MTNPKLAKLYYPFSMGETAENVAGKYKITREEQDRFALDSQQKVGRRAAAGRFADEIVPVPVPGKKRGTFCFLTATSIPGQTPRLKRWLNCRRPSAKAVR